jgi:cell division protease FtsH
MSEREKRVIAFHEGGHTLVGHVLEGTDPIHKVSIVARGRALGWTLALPTEDKYLKTRGELLDAMTMLLGGRTAEELVFGEPTTGASDDIERCTEIARSMVTTYGMSDVLGPQQLRSQPKGEVFLGRETGHEAAHSDEVAGQIDAEVRALVDGAHDRARHILSTHRATLDRLASALVEKETLDDADLAEVFGPLDKGAGIVMPRTKIGSDDRGDRVGARQLVGAALANVGPRQEVARKAEPVPGRRQGLRQRLGRWLGTRAPRPSGT